MDENLHNNSIGTLQVQTQPTGPGTQDEDLVRTLGIVEGTEKSLSIICLGRTVKSTVFPSSIVEEVGDDSHDLSHLEEDQDLARELGPCKSITGQQLTL